MDLAVIAKKASFNPNAQHFTMSLPEGYQKKKLNEQLERIYRRESAYTKHRDMTEALRIVSHSDIPQEQKKLLSTEMTQAPSGIGRYLAATITAIGAPILLGMYGIKNQGLQGGSILAGGIGGMLLYDKLVTKQPSFKKAYPVQTTPSVERLLNEGTTSK